MKKELVLIMIALGLVFVFCFTMKTYNCAEFYINGMKWGCPVKIIPRNCVTSVTVVGKTTKIVEICEE